MGNNERNGLTSYLAGQIFYYTVLDFLYTVGREDFAISVQERIVHVFQYLYSRECL